MFAIIITCHVGFSGTANGTTYKDYDECEPEKFPIEACPNVACMFYKYGPTNEALYMQVDNYLFITAHFQCSNYFSLDQNFSSSIKTQFLRSITFSGFYGCFSFSLQWERWYLQERLLLGIGHLIRRTLQRYLFCLASEGEWNNTS